MSNSIKIDHSFFDKMSSSNDTKRILRKAIKYGTIEDVKKLMGQEQWHDEWLLACAIYYGNISVAKYILGFGQLDKFVLSFHFEVACVYGHIELAKIIVELINEPRYIMRSMEMALKYAVENKYLDVFIYLDSLIAPDEFNRLFGYQGGWAKSIYCSEILEYLMNTGRKDNIENFIKRADRNVQSRFVSLGYWIDTFNPYDFISVLGPKHIAQLSKYDDIIKVIKYKRRYDWPDDLTIIVEAI